MSTKKYFRHNLAIYLNIPITCHSFKVVADESLPGETDDNGKRKPTDTASDSTDMNAEASFDSLVLGQQFCQWFFQLLNSQNPLLGQQPQDWGPQHFWPDVKLRLLSRFVYFLVFTAVIYFGLKIDCMVGSNMFDMC